MDDSSSKPPAEPTDTGVITTPDTGPFDGGAHPDALPPDMGTPDSGVTVPDTASSMISFLPKSTSPL